ncbi:MAG: 3-isopropylmalate dehydratase small subunit [Thermoleophilia bacterium]
MKPVGIVSGIVAPLDRTSVDTDQIVPKQFLKRIERSGFGEFLFYDWMNQADFPLLWPEFHGAPILATGRNFGCGSSREHAAWALQDFGYRAIVAESFGDIFAINCSKIGLLTVVLDAESVRELLDSAPAEATIDLEAQTVTLPSGRKVGFEIDPGVRERLLNGWDDIAMTERRVGDIERYEAERERDGPNTLAI